jgi:hypothetical protein
LTGQLLSSPGIPLSDKSLPDAVQIPSCPYPVWLHVRGKISQEGFLDFKQLTARRLWFISAPSIFVCLSESLASAALSLPAKSIKEILEKRHHRDDFFGALVYLYIS